MSDAFSSNISKNVAKRVTVSSLVSCHQMALNYKTCEQDRLLIMTLCHMISTVYLAQLVICLPHNLKFVNSKQASGGYFYFINLFLETVSPHEPNKKPFYFIFLLLLPMFTGTKNLAPVHEFHMQFKILVYNGCILAEFVTCSAVNVRDMSSRPATYRNNILFLHMVCAILTRQWFVKPLKVCNDKFKNQTLQPQTACDKHEVLVLVLFNMSSA